MIKGIRNWVGSFFIYFDFKYSIIQKYIMIKKIKKKDGHYTSPNETPVSNHQFYQFLENFFLILNLIKSHRKSVLIR